MKTGPQVIPAGPFFYGLFWALELRSVGDPVDQIDDSLGVTPFIIVPRQRLRTMRTDGHGQFGIEDGRMRIADDVGRNDGVCAVFQNPLHLSLCRFLDDLVDIFTRDRLFKGRHKIDH